MHRKNNSGTGAKQNALCLAARGNERAAKAMTTALSPDRMMLIQMIFSKPIQNSGLLAKIP
jgi:hypothetical protein